jgi:hypothetical protein
MHAQGELREIKEELRSVRPERHGLVSELGDLLFNTILLVKVCERDEIGGVTLAGCAAFAAAKVQRRAPFVFVEGGSQTSKLSADQASNLWKAVKEQEKAGLVPVCPDGEIACRLTWMMLACLDFGCGAASPCPSSVRPSAACDLILVSAEGHGTLLCLSLHSVCLLIPPKKSICEIPSLHQSSIDARVLASLAHPGIFWRVEGGGWRVRG